MLAPGHTLALRQLVDLTASGQVTISALARFLSITHYPGGTTLITDGHSPFGRRWPSLAITVQPRAPAERILSLVHFGPVVAALAPLRVRSHLLYLFGASCEGTSTTNAVWQPIPSGVVYDPGCPGANEQWSVAIGAPGFAIAQATFSGRGEGKV